MTNDEDLVARMRAGEQRAFNHFFGEYAGRLANFAARRCALDPTGIEDVVQLTLINAIRKLASFRGEASLFTWLCTICRNQLADVRRKAARQPKLNSLDSVMEADPDAQPIQLLDYRDPLSECADDSSRSEVRRIVNSLPPRYAKVLELRYGDDLTIEEIAVAIGVTESAAQSLLARARHSFKDSWLTDQSNVPIAREATT